MQLSRSTSIAWFLLFAGLWFVGFLTDAGNFWHGGTAASLIVTESAAALGALAFLEVVRSNVHKVLKVGLGVVALPLVLFVLSGLFYAAKRLFEV